MTDKIYNVTHVQGEVYLNTTGKAVNGFRVTLEFPKFNEGVDILVPNLKTETVKAKADEILAQREALAALG